MNSSRFSLVQSLAFRNALAPCRKVPGSLVIDHPLIWVIKYSDRLPALVGWAGVDVSDQSNKSSTTPSSEEATDAPSATSSRLSSPVDGNAADDHPEEPQNHTNNPADAPSKVPEKPIHPLEALYKRPRPQSDKPSTLAPIKTSFNFFEPDTDDTDTATLANPPQTPFTRQDWQKRNIRSAAPTPDTAAPGKRFSMPWSKSEEGDSGEDHADVEGPDEGDSDEEGDDYRDGDDTSVPVPAQGSADRKHGMVAGAAGVNDTEDKPESEFAKWFWQHRGDLNRAWKERRREALKQQRQRENKKLGRRIL